MGTNARYKDPKDLEKLNRRQMTNVRGAASAKYTTRVLNRIGQQALGELKDKDGESYDMSPSELRACELIMKKTLPDLQMVTHVDETHNLQNKSREELAEMITGLLTANPMLAKMTELQHAVDSALTVKVIDKGVDDE